MSIMGSDRDRIYRAQLLRVVDGDTMDVLIDQGFETSRRERLRLFGIDTPESYGVKKDSDEYRAGIAAKNFVEAHLLVGGTVWLRTLKTGKFGRYLALVWANQSDVDTITRSINAQLIDGGHAELYAKDPLPLDADTDE